jgi:hypothetical protein
MIVALGDSFRSCSPLVDEEIFTECLLASTFFTTPESSFFDSSWLVEACAELDGVEGDVDEVAEEPLDGEVAEELLDGDVVDELLDGDVADEDDEGVCVDDWLAEF